MYMWGYHIHPIVAKAAGLSAAEERKQRICDLLWTLNEYGGRLYKGRLITAAVRQWPITRKTAEEYIESLLDAQWCEMAAGVTICITEDGKRHLTRVVPRPIEAEHMAVPSPSKTKEDAT